MSYTLSELDTATIDELRAKVAELTRENAALKSEIQSAYDLIQAGVNLMPLGELDVWYGVRAWLELASLPETATTAPTSTGGA